MDFTAGIKDIILNPDKHGIGAGIKQNDKDGKKATDTIVKQEAIKEKAEEIKKNVETMAKEQVSAYRKAATDVVQSQSDALLSQINIFSVESSVKQIFGNNNKYVNSLVDDVLGKTVDQMIQEQIKKGKLSLQTSKLGTTYATARAYYKKLYDGSIIMTQLRNKTEENISKSITQRINDKVARWQNGLPTWQKQILAQSKLMSSLTAMVNQETKKCIESIFSDSVIKNTNEALINNLKKTKKWVNDQLVKSIGPQIEYFKKLRSAIQDKIKLYTELKDKFQKRIMTMINQFKEKLTTMLKDFTTKLVDSIKGSIKLGGIKI